MGKPRQIIYHVEAKPYGDTVNYVRGEENIPLKGDAIERGGKKWKVTHVATETGSDPKIVPIVRIFLTDDLTLPIYS